MIYFLAWLLILPLIYGTYAVVDWAMDFSNTALSATVGLPVIVSGVCIGLLIVIWPFYMNSDQHRQIVTLDATIWKCAVSETVIEPVHHLVGKIIVTTNEPVSECVQYARQH